MQPSVNNNAATTTKPVGNKSLRSLPGGKQPKQKAKGIVRLDRNIDANLEIDPSIFVFLYGECLENAPKEISGFGHISDGLIDWACISTVGTSGSVSTEVDDVTWATLQCLEACGEVPNLQLHTHPDFDTYFSGVDTNDIVKFIDQARDLTEKGQMYFMVYNLGAMLVRKIEWTKEEAFYNDGKIVVSGYELRTTVKSQAQFSGVVTNGQAVQRYTDDYSGYYGGATYVYGKPSSAKKETVEAPSQPLLIEDKDGAIRTVRAMRRSYRTLEGVIDNICTNLKLGQPIRNLIAPLLYYDIREIRAWMNEHRMEHLWDQVLMTIKAISGETGYKQEIEFLIDYAEMVEDPAHDDGIRECVSVFNIASWYAAEAAIVQMLTMPHLRDLAELLNAESHGVCFPSVLTVMEDNWDASSDDKEVMRANEAVINSLPKNVEDAWNKWMEAIDEYDNRHTQTTIVSAKSA